MSLPPTSLPMAPSRAVRLSHYSILLADPWFSALMFEIDFLQGRRR
jgi:hypothetical protein